MYKKILIMGLPGSGKTTLANALVPLIGAIHWNADEVRSTINSHLGFEPEDRIKQAKTMRYLADQVVESGKYCVVDFICPLPETREAFDVDHAYVVWMDRIEAGRFEDTNQLFVPPEKYNVRVFADGRSAEEWAEEIAENFIW